MISVFGISLCDIQTGTTCRVVKGLKTDRMSCYLTTLFCAARESNKIQDPGCGERERSVGLMTIEGSVII